MAIQEAGQGQPTENKPHEGMSRRKFLIGAGGAAAAVGLTALGISLENRIPIPGLASDGTGSGSDSNIDPGENGNGPLQAISTETPNPTATEPTKEPTKTPEVIAEPTLADIARTKSQRVGVQMNSFSMDNPKIKEVTAHNFNQILIGQLWGGKGANGRELRPARDTYKFEYIDPAIKFARDNNMPILLFHLISANPNANPSWVVNGNFSAQQQDEITDEHEQTVIPHVRELAGEDADITLSVLNEYFANGSGNIWWAKGGDEFLFKRFRKARSIDPRAKLVLNGTNNHMETPASNTDYVRAGKMVSEGILDIYGIQSHLKGDVPVDLDSFKRNLERFMKLGKLKVALTEVDMDMSNVPGTDTEKDEIQAEKLGLYLDAYYSMGGDNVTYFGNYDTNSWLGPKARATLFYPDFSRKPSYNAAETSLEHAKG